MRQFTRGRWKTVSKKDKKICQCYQCKFPIKGARNIAGWDKMRWVAHPEWPEEWVPICGDCAKEHTVGRVNTLYGWNEKGERV